MSGELCPYCSESVDVLLSLPCHPEHRICGTCLERQTGPIGRAVSCPQCREKFAWLNPKLLAVSGGELPKEQTCSPCRNQNKPRVAAEFFCQECQNPMCADCDQVHQSFFKPNGRHISVSFQQYCSRSDLMGRYLCQGQHHIRPFESVSCICKNCQRVSCWNCGPARCSCSNNDPDLERLEDYVKLKTKILSSHLVKLALLTLSESVNARTAQDGMKDMQMTCEAIIQEIEDNYELKIHQLEQEKETKISNIHYHLQTTAAEVSAYIEKRNQTKAELSKLSDCIKPLLDFTHPAHLVEVYDDVIRQIRETVNQAADESFRFRTPVYHRGRESEDLSISYPPEVIGFIRTKTLPNQIPCCSVAVNYDGYLYHQATIQQQPYLKGIHCIRLLDDGYLYARTEHGIKLYARASTSHSRPFHSVAIIDLAKTSRIAHFAIFKKSIIIARPESKTISIYNLKYEQMVVNVSHPSLTHPFGICANAEGDIFCTDLASGSLFKFSLAKTGDIQKICEGLMSPSGLTLHRGFLYVLSNKGSKIYVLTQQGKLVKTLSVPDLKPSAHDISINDSGLVAIANRDHGIKIYQLTYYEPFLTLV